MYEGALKQLLSDDLLAVAHTIAGAPALRQYFAARQEVQDVAFALSRGVVLEQSVRAFAEKLLDDLETGRPFPHDLTFAALAVALEGRHTQFADEYLQGLAELNAAEMPFGPRVAREVLSHKSTAKVQISHIGRPEQAATTKAYAHALASPQPQNEGTVGLKTITSAKVG